jgi:class 3 adenylate cyclase
LTVVACPICAHANRPGARFCENCGNQLWAPPAALTDERKVVTALFCDLVGFTALSEGADPEDVDRMLAAYFAMARAQIEAHGGVVEKFIGDAVLGVFGVPAAHEDDPERATRAALRIVEAAADLRTVNGTALRLRIGINTGEALVRVGVSPGSGERFLAGDAINTASRIQSAAPEMGVAVGLTTWELTRSVFEYAELPPATLKGKVEPVRVFHARAPLGRVGTDVARSHAVPFVGREIDVALLRGLYEKVVASESPGLVTIVGEPGLGKTRLVGELYSWVDARSDLIQWRQGRCLPYGDGITYWALGEIVKAHAGILGSDPVDVAAAKLEAVLAEGEERPWFRQRLSPLIGIVGGGAVAQEESFTANHEIFTPTTVRTALGIGGPDFAERLLEGMQPFCPFAENMLLSASASIMEARDDLKAAATAYADAATRWEAFGVIVEHAFARLGLGRCLVRLDRRSDAEAAIATARALFASLHAEPHVAEADALMAEVSAA